MKPVHSPTIGWVTPNNGGSSTSSSPTMLRTMGEGDSGHSRDLDEVRRMLFPTLSPAEGWARIDRAIQGATDDDRWASIEEAAKQQDLSADLLERLRKSAEKEME